MLTFRMLIFPMLLCHLKSETLKPWNFESCTSNFCCLSLPPLNLTFLMLAFPLSLCQLQIWNLETAKPSLQVFAVCLCPLNLTFWMLTFRMLTFPMLLCHKAFLLSKTKCAVLKYEMYRFQRGSEFSSYEIELRNPVTQNDVTLRVTNSNILIQVLLSNY